MTHKFFKKFELGPLQKKWIEALRSGEYKQCTTVLHDVQGGGYCCLGVACSLIEEPDIRCRNADEEDDPNKLKAFWGGKNKVEQSFEILPVSFKDKFKFIGVSGDFDSSSLTNEEFEYICYNFADIEQDPSLAEFNDNGVSFKVIADLVEEFPHIVFTGPA